MPVIADIHDLKPHFAAAAQAVYDEWQQDEEGCDPELGTGGICDLIADRIVDVVNERYPDIDIAAEYIEVDTHTVVVIGVDDGVFNINIPARVYEIGGGYTWRKIPGVEFGPDDIEIFQLSRRREDFPLFTSSGEYVDSPTP